MHAEAGWKEKSEEPAVVSRGQFEGSESFGCKQEVRVAYWLRSRQWNRKTAEEKIATSIYISALVKVWLYEGIAGGCDVARCDSISSSQDGPLETDVSSPEPSSENHSAVADIPSPESSQGAPSPQKADPDDTCISVVVEPSVDDALESITVSIEPVDDADKAVVRVTSKRKYQRKVYREQTPPARTRTPGDYVLTPLLLSEPAMAWVQCGMCSTPFVQQNAYFTRASCPRCERHSKVYGYMWPKTDKEGSRDKEERVLDHRTVHRFLDSYEEKRARGRKAGPPPQEVEEEVASRGRSLKRKSVTKPAAKAKAGSRADSGIRRSGRARTVSRKLVGEC